MTERVTVGEIQETFYNMMIDIVYDDMDYYKNKNLSDPTVIKELTFRTIYGLSINDVHWTLSGKRITIDNVPTEYKSMFEVLRKIRLTEDQRIRANMIDRLVQNTFDKNAFVPMIIKIDKFFKSSIAKDTEISVDDIRNTFYNLMVMHVLDKKIIPKEDLENYEGYIFFSLSAYVVLTTAIGMIDRQNQPTRLLLINNKYLTKNNCPDVYKEFYGTLIKVSDKLSENKFSKEELNLMLEIVSHEEGYDMPEELKKIKSAKVMAIIAIVKNMAIEISQLHNFKEIINNVIKFCLDSGYT
jgi:hypothetical protein